MQKVVLATGNAGKVRELASLLSDFGRGPNRPRRRFR